MRLKRGVLASEQNPYRKALRENGPHNDKISINPRVSFCSGTCPPFFFFFFLIHFHISLASSQMVDTRINVLGHTMEGVRVNLDLVIVRAVDGETSGVFQCFPWPVWPESKDPHWTQGISNCCFLITTVSKCLLFTVNKTVCCCCCNFHVLPLCLSTFKRPRKKTKWRREHPCSIYYLCMSCFICACPPLSVHVPLYLCMSRFICACSHFICACPASSVHVPLYLCIKAHSIHYLIND